MAFIIKPVVTEKMTKTTEKRPNRYGFIVRPEANKIQIKEGKDAELLQYLESTLGKFQEIDANQVPSYQDHQYPTQQYFRKEIFRKYCRDTCKYKYYHI